MRSRRKERRQRLLVLNQYYWPGFEATAHLLHELCTKLARDFDVTVLTGLLPLPGIEAGESVIDGVTVIRVPSTSYPRSRLPLRAINYVTYLLHAVRIGLRLPRPDVILCMTDPPIVGDIGLLLARRFRVPLVVASQDVFPEVAVEVNRISNPLLIGLLRKLIELYLVRADRVVAIGETMRQRLEDKGAPGDRLRVIPNWVESSALTPQPHDNEWAGEHELDGRFVVMHSGNVGHAQNLDALVRAASFLRDVSDLTVAIIGGGARYEELQQLVERLEVEAVRFLPYQSRDVLPLSLSAADIHVVGLAKGLSGYVVPSRVYGIMAVGRPLIVSAERTSETAILVERVGCGIVIDPGRPEVLAGVIRRARNGEFDLEEMGRRARAYAEEEADRTIAVDRYRRVLAEVLA